MLLPCARTKFQSRVTAFRYCIRADGGGVLELADRGDADALMPTEIRVRCLFPVQDLGDAEPVPAECVTHFGAWLTDSTDALNSCTARSLPVSLCYDLLAGA